jgi:protein-S-isoprenylcysteine O-methyltransferase Ste14
VTEPLVFTNGAVGMAFFSATGAWAVFELVMNVRQRWRAGRRHAHDPTYFVVYLCVAAAIVVSELLGRRGSLLWPGGRIWPVAAGMTLLLAGVALRAWSIATLGRFFQYQIQIQAEHTVVTAGPYRWVRHPSYTGVALAVTGFALASGDVLSLVAAVILTAIGLAVRIRAEERQLMEALGADYERFAAERKRVIPGIW